MVFLKLTQLNLKQKVSRQDEVKRDMLQDKGQSKMHLKSIHKMSSSYFGQTYVTPHFVMKMITLFPLKKENKLKT